MCGLLYGNVCWYIMIPVSILKWNIQKQ